MVITMVIIGYHFRYHEYNKFIPVNTRRLWMATM